MVIIMAFEAQLPLDPAGRSQFSRGSCDALLGGGTLLKWWGVGGGVGGGWTKGLGGGEGMMDGPRGECQNHKSHLNLTPSSYKVYLHFHVASTFKTSMFRHLKAA